MKPLLAPEPTAPVEPAAVPTFSVIVAAYQVADLIGEAIESVLAQTAPPLEIVVCDDGSTDETPDISIGTLRGSGTSATASSVRKSIHLANEMRDRACVR